MAGWVRLYDANAYLKRNLLAGDPKALPNFYLEIQTCNEPCVVVWDGPNSLYERRKIFPSYKAKRAPKASEIYESLRHMRKILNHSRAVQVRVPGFEADDVVATLAVSMDDPVAIYSHDYDFAQLAVIPRIVCGAEMKSDVPVEWVRLYKTWVGDPSDCVPGVKGFGKKSWQNSNYEHLDHITLAADPFYDVSHYASTVDVYMDDLPNVRNWLLENRETLWSYWQVVGFQDVPSELIDEHTVIGDNDRAKAQELLKQFMWVPHAA